MSATSGSAHPDPELVAKGRADARMWRETIGASQLGIPVSTRKDMLLDHMRLFSLMHRRLAHMPRQSRWYATMQYYVGLLSDKIQALGGNPWQVPATPDGAFPQLPWVGAMRTATACRTMARPMAAHLKR
jgi:hypothetical protein